MTEIRERRNESAGGGTRHYLLASDFDQTLSFNDSGQVLADLIGASCYEDRVAGLARSNLVQQGGELAYLIRHDPDFRGVRREHLREAGRRVRLKQDIPALVELLEGGVEGHRFSFFVISAAPRELAQAALAGVVDPERVYGAEFDYEADTGEVRAVRRVPAGYGKVAVIEELESELGTPPERTIYVGDGSSDVHVMLHVNNRDGLTIAVSENPHLANIARRTVLSDNAMGVAVPVLEEVAGRKPAEIRRLFEEHRHSLEQWDRSRTDRITVGAADGPDAPLLASKGGAS